MNKTSILFFLCFLFLNNSVKAQDLSNYNSISPGKLWFDNTGKHINAHGGGVLFHNGKYYWFGENKDERSNSALVGVMCYSSTDLYNWTNEGVALSVSEDESSPIVKGSIIERPKVIYNETTKQFVMYFHLELKGKGYAAAHVGIATSKSPTGPFTFIKSSRVNAGKWPLNMPESQQKSTVTSENFKDWWTPEWTQAVKEGLFVRRDFAGGQMSRDMTLFVDDDKKAYHVYSSEENLTIHIAELTDDYLNYTGKYIRIEPAGHNEAPALFKKDGKYFMFTSGCTGWDPNAARLLTADSMLGEWTLHPNPCVGRGAELTFRSQSTAVIPVAGKKDAFIFMADRWIPTNPIDGRYIWLPVLFENGMPVLKWHDEWSLDVFDKLSADFSEPKDIDGYRLVWNDEFNQNGAPNPKVWSHEKGFERNNELQWYQPENAYIENGVLKIVSKKEQVKNPAYDKNSSEWRKNREYAEYTSSSIKTIGKKEFLYGRFEIRAKIPAVKGSWPAIWTLGKSMEWPSNGEIDIMEFYQIDNQPHILANAAWGTDKRYNAKWNTQTYPFRDFLRKDPNWADKFHIWRMDWDEEAIRIYLDDVLLNETLLENTTNGSLGKYKNPFKQPHYILLNLAIGGVNGGDPTNTIFPLTYEIDYVRVYQKK